MNAYTFQLIASVAYLVVGVRLLWLGGRTGETPEKLLGLRFLGTGLAYLGWIAPPFFRLDEAQSSIDFVVWFDLVPWAMFDASTVFLLLFVRVVFRPDESWAKGLVATCTLMLSAAMVAWFSMRPDFYFIENPWYWCNLLGFTIPMVWMTIEGFLSWLSARRRVRIGLCPPVVASRYLLFAWFGAVNIALSVLDPFQMMELADYGFAGSAGMSPGFDLAYGVLELVGIALLYFVFFPPRFYRDWINAEKPAISISVGTSR